MAFALGGAGALLKSFIPTFPGLRARGRSFSTGLEPPWRRAAEAADRAAIPALSAEAEAALATLDLPPDGPIDPDATQRARLSPDIAARNFVRWAQALGLAGDYATRSIYALYCEFSEVDGRPPLRDTRFLPVLAKTEGIAVIARGKDKAFRLWHWTIEAAKPAPVAEAIADVWAHISAPAPDRAPGGFAEATASAMDRKPDAATSPTARTVEPALPSAARAPVTVAPAVSQSPAARRAQPLPPAADRTQETTAAAVPPPPAAETPSSAGAPAAAASISGRASEPTAPADAGALEMPELTPASAAELTAPAPQQVRAKDRRREKQLASKRSRDVTAPAASQAPGSDARPAKPAQPRSGDTEVSAAATAAMGEPQSASPTRSSIILPRFIPDAEHPFSPAGLREREKGARRIRLNAAASRKQRGGVRRAA
jgi:hypothetical protein